VVLREKAKELRCCSGFGVSWTGMESEREELVGTFKSLTDTETEFARSFLEANGWNLQEAIDLYLGGGAVSGSGGITGNSAVTSSSSAAEVTGPQDDGAGAKALLQSIMSAQNVDELTARAIMEAQGSSEAGQQSAGQEEDGVRAPMQRTTGRLFDAPGFLSAGPASRASTAAFRNFEEEARMLEARKRAERANEGLGTSAVSEYDDPDLDRRSTNRLTSRRTSSSNRRTLQMNDNDVDDDDDEYVYEDEDDAMDEDSDGDQARDRNLKTLFEPPREIMHRGSFHEARQQARNERRWLLVNIQQDSEFFSYVLNRDLWQADVIQDILKSSFVFFQREAGDSEAQEYIRFYKPTSFPYVGIIDPRTGELVVDLQLKTRSTESDPNDLRSSFLDKVSRFLETHTIAATVVSEEQQNGGQGQTAPATPPPAPLSSTSTELKSFAKIEYESLEEEPTEGVENTTKIRFRLFDGATRERRFRTDQRISQLFSFVNSLISETNARPFDLLVSIPPKSLKSEQEKTLSEMNLMRAALKAKWDD